MNIEEIIGYKTTGELLKLQVSYPRKKMKISLFRSYPEQQRDVRKEVLHKWNYLWTWEDKMELVFSNFPEIDRANDREMMLHLPDVLDKLIAEERSSCESNIMIDGTPYKLASTWEEIHGRELNLRDYMGDSIPIAENLTNFCSNMSVPSIARDNFKNILQGIRGYSMEDISQAIGGMRNA